MKKFILPLVLGMSLALSAQAVETNKVIEFRQGAFQVISWNFGILVGMAKGNTPYDKAKAELAAKYLAMTAEMVKQGFIPGTYEGSNAKPTIETKSAEFEKHYAALLQETQKMVEVAGDEKALKAQVGKVGGTCKSCHDVFKKD